MKKIFLLSVLTMFVMSVLTASAQNQNGNNSIKQEQLVVNASDLTPQQLLKIKSDQMLELQKNKIESYGSWVGVGGEIGTAVREGLTGVVDVSDKFGKTDVGKFTLVMVAWKVMGKDIIRIIIGLIFIISIIVIVFYSFRKNCITRKVIVENPGWFRYPKKYEIVEPKSYDGTLGLVIFLHFVFCFAGIGITYAIMFG